MAKSDYLENAVVNHVLRNTALPAVPVVYIALSKADPLDTGAGLSEPTGGYARKAATFSAPTNGATSNSALVIFGAATASWGTITHFAAFSAATGGNMLYHGALTASKVVAQYDSLEFPAGNLTISES